MKLRRLTFAAFLVSSAERNPPKPRLGEAKADKKSEAQISYFNYTLFPLDFQINSY